MKFLNLSLIAILICSVYYNAVCQIYSPSANDSIDCFALKNNQTRFGGYGMIYNSFDFDMNSSAIIPDRFVFNMNHSFNHKISLFSSVAYEDDIIDDSNISSDIYLEQAYLKFNLSNSHYIIAGLFLPQIGSINSGFMPELLFGNQRPQVETFVIPSFWREYGFSFNGKFQKHKLFYGLAFMNGLDCSRFLHESAFRNGRLQGINASFNNFAFNAYLKYFYKNLKFQFSGYYGGSVNLPKRIADTLGINSGPFAIPVVLAECNLLYEYRGLTLRALAATAAIPDAFDINRVYNNFVPKALYGAYIEAAYNLLHDFNKFHDNKLIFFFRYENLDLSRQAPSNGYLDRNLNRENIVIGLNFLPIKNIAIKSDVRYMHTANQDAAHFTYLNLGLAFSF